MLHKTRGIVFHTVKYGENGIVVKIFTESSGLQSYIINSVRSKKGKFKSSVFEPLSLVELVSEQKENRGLQRIKEIRTQPVFHSIPDDIVKSSILMFLNEVLYKSIQQQGHIDHPLFNFIFNSIQILDLETEIHPDFHLFFMVQLSRYLGFFPHGDFSDDCCYFDLKEGCFISSVDSPHYTLDKELSGLLFNLIQTDYDHLSQIKISSSKRRLLLNRLLVYFELHISSFRNMKTPEILHEVLK
jgi:DNA repair protein RecO (recombination protein O)